MEDPAVTARLDQIEALLADIQKELDKVTDALGVERIQRRRADQDLSWIGFAD